jgi:hypothetical protein
LAQIVCPTATSRTIVEQRPDEDLLACTWLRLQRGRSPQRKAVRAHKAGGDYLDLFRLVSHPAMTRPISLSMREARHELGSWCLREIKEQILEGAES